MHVLFFSNIVLKEEHAYVLYAKAARQALQKHSVLIINVNATEISPQLYSDCLISAETFSLISTQNGTNRHKILMVFDDLQSKVALNPLSLLKFVDILRGYEEYEELANHLQSMLVNTTHKCEVFTHISVKCLHVDNFCRYISTPVCCIKTTNTK